MTLTKFVFLVVRQMYKTDGSQEYVIVGNDALIKCQYPSFVSDFLTILGWADSEGEFYGVDQDNHGTGPDMCPPSHCMFFSVIFPVPSFHFLFHFSVAHQAYRVVVHEESVILGNDVQFKCNIQSFVTDFVHLTNWIDSEGSTYSLGQSIGNKI